jgi:hypothetical protein
MFSDALWRMLWRASSHMFGLDVRSLAVFRIALASTLFFVMCNRAPDMDALFTDNGVARRSQVTVESVATKWRFSLHLVTGNMAQTLALFAIHFAAIVSMFIGYRTRVSTFVCWMLELSLQNRNAAVLMGGDKVSRFSLLYAMFLPIGGVWSLDALLRTRQRKQHQKRTPQHEKARSTTAQTSMSTVRDEGASGILQRFFEETSRGIQRFFEDTSPPPSNRGSCYSNHNLVCSIGTMAAVTHICLLYWNAGVYKIRQASWVKDWDAIERALHQDEFTTHIGWYMREVFSPTVLGIFTVASNTLELMCPLLVLLPLGLYSRRLGTIYRGCCIVTFCLFHISIRLALDVKFFSVISIVMWTALVPGDFWEGQGGGARWWCCRRLSTQLPHAHPPPQLRVRASPLAPYNTKLSRLPLWKTILLGAIMYTTISENVGSVYPKEQQTYLPLVGPLNALKQGMRLDQSWGMFSTPRTGDGWYETTGVLNGNATVDLMGWGGPVPKKPRFNDAADYSDPAFMPQTSDGKDRPMWFVRRFASSGWKKFIMMLREKNRAKWRLEYGKYLCRTWNGLGAAEKANDKGQLLTFKIKFHHEPSVWIGKGQGTRTETLHSHRCFKLKEEDA